MSDKKTTRDVAQRDKHEVRQPESAASSESAVLRVEPAANIYETETDFYIVADLPGVGTDDLQVIADGSSLAITAKAPVARPAGMEGEDVLRQFERWFSLPDGVDQSAADARLTNGVLTLRLPKAAEARVHRITVKGS
ncbi:MAG TPA: Hsp20/alpha crystallin family protein [Planctomycetota bacterium]|nr:Hsp20/alpha crystallin family protein [Planctomycetota bacterium]